MRTHLNPPKNCDTCGIEIETIFYDGKTHYGPWANMCPICHDLYGVGLGTGRGQRWELRDGKFKNTGG